MRKTRTPISFDTKKALDRYKIFDKTRLVAPFAITNNTDWFKGAKELHRAGFLKADDARVTIEPNGAKMARMSKIVFEMDIRKFTTLNRRALEKGMVSLPQVTRKAVEERYAQLTEYLTLPTGGDDAKGLDNTATYFTGMTALSEYTGLKLKEKDPEHPGGDLLLLCSAAGSQHWLKQVENRKIRDAKRERAASGQMVH